MFNIKITLLGGYSVFLDAEGYHLEKGQTPHNFSENSATRMFLEIMADGVSEVEKIEIVRATELTEST